ncbi:RNA 2',3'-cyclic phosphodiesterase [bacterium]|nr:RNA 2',3'-cyclic phosphodiesterase [bacterium]
MKRIFIAINLPEKIKTELENLEKELDSLFPEEANRGVVRWVKKENLHLTLLFIGSVEDEKIPKIRQIVKNIAEAQKPFSLKFKKVCYGPPKQIPPRLIWIELEKKPELLNSAEKLKKEMAKSGILRKVEKREFSPHITLGRIRTWQWRRIEPEERPEIEKEISLDFEVKSIEIMESKLKRTGAEYTILESIALG